MSLGKHFLKFGARLRANRDSNESGSNFNGSFTFGSRPNPMFPPKCAVSNPPPNCPPPQITGLEAYQMTIQGLAQGMTLAQIIAHRGRASVYSVTSRTPLPDVTYLDAG